MSLASRVRAQLSAATQWEPVVAAVLCIAGVLVPRADAQAAGRTSRKQIVIPTWHRSKVAVEFPDYFTGAPGSSVRVQYGYNPKDLGVSRALLTGIAFRKPNFWMFNPEPAAKLQMTVDISHGPRTPGNMLWKFAPNLGSDNTRVFRGAVTWPAVAPREFPGFVARIPFQRPFGFDVKKGRSLVVDIHKSGSTARRTWVTAVAYRDMGRSRIDSALHGCWIRYQNRYMSLSGGKLYPGGQWSEEWFAIPRKAPCISTLGFQGVGSYWGGRKLPISLGSTCGWAVPPVLVLRFFTDANGYGKIPVVPIPRDPNLVGSVFYEQSGCFTNKYNALGFVTFFSIKFGVGTGDAPDARFLFNDRGYSYASGQPNAAPILRVTMR